jgi:hypothetical protein
MSIPTPLIASLVMCAYQSIRIHLESDIVRHNADGRDEQRPEVDGSILSEARHVENDGFGSIAHGQQGPEYDDELGVRDRPAGGSKRFCGMVAVQGARPSV